MLFAKGHSTPFCTHVFGRNQNLDLDLRKKNSVRLNQQILCKAKKNCDSDFKSVKLVSEKSLHNPNPQEALVLYS